jgi:NDP-sugar pyrophosphorylase family protein
VKALVLCGGFGTRLGKLCQERPKPLLKVGRLALVEHTLLRLGAAGLHDVFVNLHFGAAKLRARLGDGRRYGVRINYFPEESLLGTAGTPRALGLAELLNGDGLLVHYGDVLSEHPLDRLVARHRESGARARIVVHERPGSNSRVTLGAEDRVERFVERPADGAAGTGTPWAFSGICALSAVCVASLPEAPSDLPRDVFPALARSGQLFAERHVGYRCAIDSPERLESARRAWKTGTLKLPTQPEVT